MLLPTYILIAVLVIAALVMFSARSRRAANPARPFAKSRRWRMDALAVLALVLAAVFAFAFYDRYWRWRDCFNELGRCYDPESQIVYLEQAGDVWGLFAVLSLAAALLLALRRRR